MSYLHRTLMAATIAVAATGLVPGAAPAAERQVCYFDDCVPTKAAPIPSETPAPAPSGDSLRTLAEHGSWIAVSDGKIVLVMDRFEDGATFSVAYSAAGIGFLVSSKSWSMTEGDTSTMKVNIDGDVYTGKAVAINATTMLVSGIDNDVARAFYRASKVEVIVADDTFTMSSISDASATVQDVAGRTFNQ